MFQRTSALCLLVLASMGAACAAPAATDVEAPVAPVASADPMRSNTDTLLEAGRDKRATLEAKTHITGSSLNPYDVAWEALSMFVVDPLMGYVKGKGEAQIMELVPFADATDRRLEVLSLKMDALLAAQKDMKDSIDGLKTALGASTAFLTAQSNQSNLIGYMAPITAAAETTSTAGLSYYLSGKPAKSSQAQLESDMQTFIDKNSQVEMSKAMSSIAGVGKSSEYFPAIARYAALTRNKRSNFESMQLLRTAYLNIAMRQITALKLMAQRDQFIVYLKEDGWEAEHRVFDDGMGGGVQVDYLQYMRDVADSYVSASVALAGMLSGDSVNNATSDTGNVVLAPEIGQALALAVASARGVAGESAASLQAATSGQSMARVVVLSRGNDATLANDKKQSAITFVSGTARANGADVALVGSVATSIIGSSGGTCLSGALMRTDGDAKGEVRLELSNAWRLTEVSAPLPSGASKATVVLSVNGMKVPVDVSVTSADTSDATTQSGYGFDLRFAGRAANATLDAQASSNMFRTTWSTFGDSVLRNGAISATAASLAGGDASAGADQWVRLNVKVNNSVRGAKLWTVSRGSVAMNLQYNPSSPNSAWRNDCSLQGDEQRTSVTSMISFGGTVLFGSKDTFASHVIPSTGCTKDANFVYRLYQPMDGTTTYAKREDLARQVRATNWKVSENTVDLTPGITSLVLDAGYNNIRGLEGDPRRRFIESDVQLGAFSVFVEGDGS